MQQAVCVADCTRQLRGTLHDMIGIRPQFNKIFFFVVPTGLMLGLTISNVAWAILDQHIWPWDQAMYGNATLELWETREIGAIAWLWTALHTLPATPPLIAWVGQFFVPLRRVCGEFRSALLLLNVFGATGIFIVIYLIRKSLGAGKIQPA